MLKEFKEFAMRGNVIDMAVGIVLGVAFNNIVKSMVDNVIMPPIGLLIGRVDFSNLFVTLSGQHYQSLAEAQKAGAPAIAYGLFINTIINFVIVAFAMFILVRAMMKIAPAKPAASTTKECPYCVSTIPLAAVRCPNCTSEIKAAA